MSDLTIDLLHGMAALLALAVAAASWLRASRALRRGGAVERWLDGALVLCWIAIVFFFLLAGLGVYRVWIAIGSLLAGGLIAGRIAARVTPSATTRSPATSASALRERHDADSPHTADLALENPRLSDPFLWAALPVAVIALVRLIKSMVAPPMAWDAMTVHLPKAAFWIQSGSLSLPDFPDAWTYYRWFPAGGEVLFAWVMLPFRSDLLLGPFGFGVWLAIWIAGARLARLLGAPSQTAWIAGGAVAALPAVLVFMTANYVDNLVVLFALLAVTHTLLFLDNHQLHNGILGLAAIGVAIAIKTSSILLAAPLVFGLAAAAWRCRGRLGRVAAPTFGAALALPCVGYLWTWLETGSPLYPVRAPGLGLPFHAGLAQLFSGEVFAPTELAGPGWPGFLQLFWSTPTGAGWGGSGHMNFGIGGAALAAGALAGLVLASRRGDRRPLLLLCLAGATITALLVLSPGNLALRTVWIGVLGRHLLPAFVPLALCAALLPGSTGRLVSSASLLLASIHFFPIGWSVSMTAPAARLTALALASALAVYALRRFGARTLGLRLRYGLAAVVVVLFLSTWTSIRERVRYPIYRETAPGLGAFDAHPIHPSFAMAGSLWPILDSPESKTVAVVVGPDPVGHNQFFYPLLGSRFQNRLIYLPTSDAPNEVELNARSRYAHAQPQVWLANLERSSVDIVVGLWQPTPEREWLTRERGFEVAALTDLGVPWIGRRRAASAQEPAP